jgi:hypothetical protein
VRRSKLRGSWLFLGLVLAVYGVVAVTSPHAAIEAWSGFTAMLMKVVPVLVVVLILMLLSERFLTPRRIARWLGRDSGTRGWFLAAGAGVFATGPVYPWYALLAELHRKGMRSELVAVLLYARAVKLPLLPLMAHYFGVPFTLALSFWLLVFALLSGLVALRFSINVDHQETN